MGIISKTVKVFPRGKAIAYYKGKGYAARYNQELEVKVEDLSPCSTALVETTCDYCGTLRQPIKYVDYNTQTKNGTKKCCCLECTPFKREEVFLEKYGYKNAMQIPETQEKIQKTNIEKYGSKSPSGNTEVRAKQKETLMKNYGVENPSLSKEIQEKRKQTFLERFGVENSLLVSEIREKVNQTIFNLYGVSNVFYNKEIQNKKNATLIERYGTQYPLQNKDCFEKLKQTNLEKYGCEYSTQSEEVKQKRKQTSLERYGYENPMQSPEFFEKWFAKNGSNFVKSSRQQQYLCNLYNGILNYPFRCFALDVYLLEDKMDIEFDGSGHRMSISLGNITEEDFEKRELYRNVALKKEGYKQMRIISSKDLLPSDPILLQMLSEARQYFSLYPQHSWIEFNIDTSSIRNAENKDGISYDFGELRTIKDSDLTKIETQINLTKGA